MLIKIWPHTLIEQLYDRECEGLFFFTLTGEDSSYGAVDLLSHLLSADITNMRVRRRVSTTSLDMKTKTNNQSTGTGLQKTFVHMHTEVPAYQK